MYLQDSDEEEHFVDLPNPDSDTENVDQDENNEQGEDKEGRKPGLSWFHRANLNRKFLILSINISGLNG